MQKRTHKITATFSETEFQQVANKAYDSRCSKGAIVGKLVVSALDSEEEGQQG